MVRGENGWVAGNENGVAAGNRQGEGGAVNREGEAVKWNDGDVEHGEFNRGEGFEGNEGWEGGHVIWEEDRYFEDWEAWQVVMGVGAVIAIGTVLATPPPSYVTIVVVDSSYYYSDGYWYAPVYQGTEVVYQVIAAPIGGVAPTLPPQGCVIKIVNGVSYQTCTNVWYQQVPTGWRVVAPLG